MADPAITRLLSRIHENYGDRVIPYGTSAHEEHGTGFRLAGVPATFSVLTLDGQRPDGVYDVQIESYPPGDYVFAGQVDLGEFVRLVAQVAEHPPTEWPVMS